MKRFHIHIAVNNLAESIDFYSKLLGSLPAIKHPDYAKWLLDDPALNFAISSRGHASGINHLGFQVDTAQQLETLRYQAAEASDGDYRDQGESSCCYANSAKHWIIDPQGLAWEHFNTLSEIPEFGEDSATLADACCIPMKDDAQDSTQAKSECCIPATATATAPCC